MIRNLNSYQPSAGEGFLLDANVLLFVFYPLGNYDSRRIAPYSSFLSLARAQKSDLYFTSIVLSEFVNRALRIDFEKYNQVHGPGLDFKRNYRPSADCASALTLIEGIVRSIYRLAKPLGDSFDVIPIGNLFGPQTDFNDSHSKEVAKAKGLRIVTDDHDFYQYRSDLDILTANTRTLRLPRS